MIKQSVNLNQNSGTDHWNFVDTVKVLTVKDCPRINEFLYNAKKSGLSTIEIYTCIPKKNAKLKNGGTGADMGQILSHSNFDTTALSIYHNHMKMIQDSYDSGAEIGLFFEDDAIFDLPVDLEKIKNVGEWLKENPWDSFYLGYCSWPLPFSKFVTRSIVSVSSPLCAHAYMLSRDGMKKMIDLKKIHHIDALLRDELPLKYAIFPAISFQSVDPALYKASGMPMSFRSVSRTTEYLGVILPILLILILVYIAYVIWKKTRGSSQNTGTMHNTAASMSIRS